MNGTPPPAGNKAGARTKGQNRTNQKGYGKRQPRSLIGSPPSQPPRISEDPPPPLLESRPFPRHRFAIQRDDAAERRVIETQRPVPNHLGGVQLAELNAPVGRDRIPRAP